MLRGKIIAINLDIVEQKKFHINDQHPPQELEKDLVNTIKKEKEMIKAKNHLNRI